MPLSNPTTVCAIATTSTVLWLIFSLQYSMYGHIKQLAEAEKAGLKKVGIDADVYQYVPTHCDLTISQNR
jgi:hypothetical protein